jgi:hypothetical protein
MELAGIECNPGGAAWCSVGVAPGPSLIHLFDFGGGDLPLQQAFFWRGATLAGVLRLARVPLNVDVSSVQNWVGTDLIRLIKFDGDRITLRTPPLSVGGTIRTTELVFERVGREDR